MRACARAYRGAGGTGSIIAKIIRHKVNSVRQTVRVGCVCMCQLSKLHVQAVLNSR